ncbi:hypothetical protein INT45_004808 [Circinella minor]|uniref:Uncharacterized protein n=1 Tax=Circinella minor TaxID=1195481 RepID=A0A8H7RTH0_9FUNG|nr:hypothetical protein INT45_004808 [Circinella minor]
MRLSIILTISTAIYFAANNIHAVPIPSCEGDAGDCAPPSSGTVLSPEAGKINLNAVTQPSSGTKLSTGLRRRNMNNKRGEKPPTGPLSTTVTGAQAPVDGVTAPLTGQLTGPATSVGMISQGVGGLASTPGPKDLDPAMQLTSVNGQLTGVTQGVEGAGKVGGVDGLLKGGGGAPATTKGKGQG